MLTIKFSVPACVVVTVLVISPGCTKLPPMVGETGGEIKLSIGGITLLFRLIESSITDFGIGLSDAKIELGT